MGVPEEAICASIANSIHDPKLKGELNLDNKWKSDDLFYIIMNEIHPRFNQFCLILKLS